MVRTRQIHPDVMFVTRDGGEVPIVSKAALLEAMVDAASLVDMAGGVVTIVTSRTETGLPNEMVTTGAVVEWRSGTRAAPTVGAAPAAEPEIEIVRQPHVEAEVELPEEDDSAIPAGAL